VSEREREREREVREERERREKETEERRFTQLEAWASRSSRTSCAAAGAFARYSGFDSRCSSPEAYFKK